MTSGSRCGGERQESRIHPSVNAGTTRTCAVFALAWAFSMSGAAAAQDRPEIATGSGTARNIYITATASNGEPAKDLTPAEVVVREDGKHRDVLALGPAGSAQIALLVDDGG